MRSRGPSQRQPMPGNLRGAPQLSQSLTSSYSSRNMRLLAPKTQCAYPSVIEPTIKRPVSQAADVSKPEVIAGIAQQLTAVIPSTVPMISAVPLHRDAVSMPPAVPMLPAMLSVVQHPPRARGLPEFQDIPSWINSSHNVNVLSNASTLEMLVKPSKMPPSPYSCSAT